MAYVKYEAILDPPHEFLFSIGAAHEFGGTGTRRVGALSNGATGADVVLCQRAGRFADRLPPPPRLARLYHLSTIVGSPRPDNLLAGLAVEYSIPYLQSKVKAFDLPDLLRGMTPLVETLIVTPTRNSGDATTRQLLHRGSPIPERAGNSRSRREYRRTVPLVPGSASLPSSTCRSITSFRILSANRCFPGNDASPIASRRPDRKNSRSSGLRKADRSARPEG